ncbi:MAG: hypothetical protein ABRQ39_27500, partial [Candidatus Eremiobacterota bacterium]
VLTVSGKLNKCNIVAVCKNRLFCTRIIDFSEEPHHWKAFNDFSDRFLVMKKEHIKRDRNIKKDVK